MVGSFPTGRWRSLVAHLHDTQGVTGSSPVRPTILTWQGGTPRLAHGVESAFWGPLCGSVNSRKLGYELTSKVKVSVVDPALPDAVIFTV